MVRGDDRPPLEPEPPQLGRELVEARLELQIDVEADVGRLVGEERERVVERRQLRRELAELGERPRADRARGAPVAHLVEVVGVRQHERAAREVEDVELDEVDALLDGRPEGAERVLGREVRRAAVADPQDGRAVPAAQVDHAAPPLRGPEPPPCERAEEKRLRHREPGRERRHVLPEALRVDADQRVRAREAPAVALEEHLVEAREEAVEPEQDQRHRNEQRCRASRGRRRAGRAGRRCASRVRASAAARIARASITIRPPHGAARTAIGRPPCA